MEVTNTWAPRPQGITPALGTYWCSDGRVVWFVEIVSPMQFAAAERVKFIRTAEVPPAPFAGVKQAVPRAETA